MHRRRLSKLLGIATLVMPKKGDAKGGKNASVASGKTKRKGKGGARYWHCATCNHDVAGDYCSTCGVSWVFGAVLQDRADSPNPRGKGALGRKPPQFDTSRAPTYRDKLLQPANNSVMEAVLAKLDKLDKQINKSGETGYTDRSAKQSVDTERAAAKPPPGREVFVEFDGKPCNLDDLNAMLRPTVKTLGPDSDRTHEIREAIDRAHAKRQGQMEPQARLAYLEKILGTKAKEADSNESDICQCQDEISTLAAKLERLRSRSAHIASEIAKVKQDIVAASAEIGDSTVKPGFTSKRSDILNKPLFRQWLQHNKPEVYEFQEDTDWCTISDKLLLQFKRYEVHCLRIRYNLGRITETIPDAERQDIERKTMQSADWMLDTNEYFPDDLQGFRQGLVEVRANPLQADDANLFFTRKRECGHEVHEDRQKKKRVTISGPYLVTTGGGVEPLEVDDEGIQSYDVVLREAVDICKQSGKKLFKEEELTNLIYSIDEESELEAEAAKVYLLAISKHAKSIQRFPSYDDYWLAMRNGIEVCA